MNFDDTSTVSTLRAEIAALRDEIDGQRAWLRRFTKTQAAMKAMEETIARCCEEILELRTNPKALSRIAWLKASHAAVLGGGITLWQLNQRRKKGVYDINGVRGWRKINARVYEYREDIVLSASLRERE